MKKNENFSQQVKTILLNDWDPIGIKDLPEANDEYDDYVFTVCEMISEGKHESDFYDFLFWVESERICLHVNTEHIKSIAEKLERLTLASSS
ncbi:hypothetical protein [Sodalis sp. dw_96]|uniref:hypothetical protein n=1 Tax=Sodalis sp. dw_96 TaxID=2719794 RepID=UPI001BD1C960|nr:hypothetical protein [Sodalis sp. dw_96]